MDEGSHSRIAVDSVFAQTALMVMRYLLIGVCPSVTAHGTEFRLTR